MTWTQTRCALSVFFRDAKFLLEAVGITKRKKENQRVVFFLVLPEWNNSSLPNMLKFLMAS